MKSLYTRIFPRGFNILDLILRIKYVFKIIISLKYRDSNIFSRYELLILLSDKRSIKSNDANISVIITSLINSGYQIGLIGLCPNTSFKFNDIPVLFINRGFFFSILKSIVYFSSRPIIDFWVDLIKLSNCRKIICYQPSPELVKASGQFDLKVYDIQHGQLYIDHPYYMRYKNMRRTLPDYFLAWDKSSSSIANKLKIAKNIKTINFYPELFQEKKYLSPEYTNYYKYKILITLTDNINVYYRNFKAFILKKNNIGIPFFKKLFFDSDFENTLWIVRPHPNSNRDELNLIRNYIEYYNGKTSSKILYDNTNLFSQLSISNLHITHNSSCTLLASKLSIHTILTCPIYFSNTSFNNLESNGSVTKLERNFCYHDFKRVIQTKLNSSSIKKTLYRDLNSFNLRLRNLIEDV